MQRALKHCKKDIGKTRCKPGKSQLSMSNLTYPFSNENSTVVANRFNDHFTNITSKSILSKIFGGKLQNSFIGRVVNSICTCEPVSEVEICKVINSLKNIEAVGLDAMPISVCFRRRFSLLLGMPLSY